MGINLTVARIASAKPGAKKYRIRDAKVIGLSVVVLPSGVKSFAVSYRLNGKSQEKVLGRVDAITLDAARIQAREILNAAKQGVNPAARRGQTFGAFLAGHYADHVERHHKRSSETLRVLRKKWKFLHDTRLEDISRLDITRYEKLNPTISRATLDREITDLKTALNWAVANDLIDSNPIAGYRRKKTDHGAVVRYLDDDERARLMAALEGHWLRPLVLFALNTGLRKGELLALRREDIDGDDIVVHGAGAKSGRTRRIPLNNTLRQLLKELPQAGLLFPSPKTGRQLVDVKGSWGKLLAQAQITGFRWHDLRHDYATRLVAAGVPLSTVQELLGHSDVNLTRRYGHTLRSDLRAAQELL